MRIPILISVIAFISVGCLNNPPTDIKSSQNGKLVQNQDLVTDINASPASLSISGIKYLIEPFAWRNFMPSIDPPVRLTSNTTLIRKDGAEIQNIKVIQQYIVRGNEIWVPAQIEVKQNQSSPDRLAIVSRDGPTWAVGSKVDIGLKVKNQETGEVFLFSVSEVPITATY